MKKIIIPALIGVSLFAMTDTELNKYKENNLLKSSNIHLLEGKKIDKDFAMIKGYVDTPNGYMPLKIITNNKIVVTGGEVFDAKTKKKVTIDSDYSRFKKDAAFTIGDGKKDIFLFTESECPYCYRFEQNLPKLKKDYKLHVLLFPLEQIHYFAKAMAIATLSQPKKERAAYYKKMMELNQKNKTDLISELDKYSFDFYQKIVTALDSSYKDQRSMQMAQKYISLIEAKEGKKFNGISDAIKYCNNKIDTFKKDKTKMEVLKRMEDMLNNHKKIASAYMGVGGTPSMFDETGKAVQMPEVFNK